MTEEQLEAILAKAHGEDHPGDVWFIETIEQLVEQVRTLDRRERALEGD